ncbi:MAG TPA: carboxypeptidase regulatory-like domain-containing protein [Longimicrobium sp.]|nr:carboxypeptidase regulatory-like domain-containing protein [Longimicrobium sp.]
MPALHVTVMEESTGLRVAGAQVELLTTHVRGVADSAGVVRLAGVPAGPVYVEVRKLGYAPVRFGVTVPERREQRVEVELHPQAVELAGVVATAEYRQRLSSAGFYQRRRRGVGGFSAREEFQQRGYGRFSDIIRRMPGVRLVFSRDGRALVLPARDVFMGLGHECGVAVYVDGQRLHYSNEVDNLDQLIPYSDIEAVETYAPAEIPPGYQGGAGSCGVIVVWTRARS